MSFYADLRADLSALFAEEPFLNATITREAKGAYDPATRRTASGTTTAITCRAFTDQVDTVDRDGLRSSYTNAISNTAMQIGDKLTIANATYTVTSASGDNQTGVFEATVTR